MSPALSHIIRFCRCRLRCIDVCRLGRGFRVRLRGHGGLVHSADDLRRRLNGVVRVDGHHTVLTVVAEVIALDRLVDEQVLREAGQQVGVLAQQRLTLGVGLVEQVLDLSSIVAAVSSE